MCACAVIRSLLMGSLSVLLATSRAVTHGSKVTVAAISHQSGAHLGDSFSPHCQTIALVFLPRKYKSVSSPELSLPLLKSVNAAF